MIDPTIMLAGALVGFVVGLTGMGGGALLTPILVLFLGIDPLTAVSSDLVAAMVMKPVGGAVHMRRGTVNYRLVAWLMLGSIPAAFGAVIVLTRVADPASTGALIKTAIGSALLLASVALIAKAVLAARRDRTAAAAPPVEVKPTATLLIGIFGGTVVGLTSVGSGSLMIVLLLLVYPRLSARQLVGTDLVQAVPLVGSAAVAHLFFGDVQLAVTGSLLLGSLPAVYLGARVSSRAPDGLIRPILAVVLVASGLKLLAVPNELVAVSMLVLASALAFALRFGGRSRAEMPMVAAVAAVAEPDIEPGSQPS
ncbi:MAG TPA: sulfite exporter TauE/SafE family protein [Kofleriaceae bacterium]|nr:sulfite exporter TauE/SafE family protein [Kofleriaceae bacterium]